MLKKVFVVGDSRSLQVFRFMDTLSFRGFEANLAGFSELETADCLIFCATENMYLPERMLDAVLIKHGKGKLRIFPVLFKGGELPALISDLKPANLALTEGWASKLEFERLLKALNKYIR